jgi:hypothetical protein
MAAWTMTDFSKPNAARKKCRHKPPEDIVDYIVEIEDWDWSY